MTYVEKLSDEEAGPRGISTGLAAGKKTHDSLAKFPKFTSISNADDFSAAYAILFMHSHAKYVSSA